MAHKEPTRDQVLLSARPIDIIRDEAGIMPRANLAALMLLNPWLLAEEVFSIQVRVSSYRVPKTVNGGLRWLVARRLRASLGCFAGLNPPSKKIK